MLQIFEKTYVLRKILAFEYQWREKNLKNECYKKFMSVYTNPKLGPIIFLI